MVETVVERPSPAAQAVDRLVTGSPDPEAAAVEIIRLGLLAIMYMRGPRDAAMTAYQLADEMAEACR